MSERRRRRNRKNAEARFGHIGARRNEERDGQRGKGSISWGPMIRVFSAWGILSVFVSGFVKAMIIGFPWAWVQISLANLSLLIPNLGLVAFLVLLFIPFRASRYVSLGYFEGRGRTGPRTVLLMLLTALPFLGAILFVVYGTPWMGQWYAAVFHAVSFMATAMLVFAADFSVKRISEELPDDKDEARRESAGDLIRGILVISSGCLSVLSGTLSLSQVFDNASTDVLLFVASFVLAVLVSAFVIVRNPRGAENCMKRAVSSAALCGVAEEKKGVASFVLGTILVVILSAYIGYAGLMNEYAIQSIDKEQPQVYRVVAEFGGGRCVAVPIKEENGEWVDNGSITSLNVFDGYRIIKEED